MEKRRIGMAKSAFDDFLQEEIKKQEGVAFPVKAGLLERLVHNIHLLAYWTVIRAVLYIFLE